MKPKGLLCLDLGPIPKMASYVYANTPNLQNQNPQHFVPHVSERDVQHILPFIPPTISLFFSIFNLATRKVETTHMTTLHFYWTM
jgi:hypothetical protein